MLEQLVGAFLRLVEEGEAYVLLLPVYVVLLGGERLAHALTVDRPWNERDAAANIAITVAFLVLDVLVGAVLPIAVMALIYDSGHLWNLGLGIGGWAAAFVLYDLAWYVDHRIAHRSGFFWSMHHVHHSSPEYNMTVASRGFVIDNTLLSRPLFYVLPLLGVSPFHYMVVKLVTSVWGIAQHTRLVGRLGWFDQLLATPSNHRVHHGADPKYLDRNYGEVLMLWDRLWGTYQREEEEPFYGVTEPIRTNNPLRIELAGLRWLARKISSAGSWQDKLRCLYKPPEWNPPHPVD